MFRVSLQLLSETFLTVKTTEPGVTVTVCRSSSEVPLVLSGLNKTWILRQQLFEKYYSIKLHENPPPPVGAKLFQADVRMDWHDEANSRHSQFCERAWKYDLNPSQPSATGMYRLL